MHRLPSLFHFLPSWAFRRRGWLRLLRAFTGFRRALLGVRHVDWDSLPNPVVELRMCLDHTTPRPDEMVAPDAELVYRPRHAWGFCSPNELGLAFPAMHPGHLHPSWVIGAYDAYETELSPFLALRGKAHGG